MYDTAQFRKGLKIEMEGQPYAIVDFAHVTPGKGGGFTRTKLKNLMTQRQVEKTFKSGEKVKVPNLMEVKMQFMYSDAEGFHVMNMKDYEQLCLTEKQVGDQKNFFQEGITVSVLLFNDLPIAVEVPNFVELTILETEPGIKGDTASGGSKPAKLETGLVVQVPFHLSEGDKIKVDTRSSEYVEKVG